MAGVAGDGGAGLQALRTLRILKVLRTLRLVPARSTELPRNPTCCFCATQAVPDTSACVDLLAWVLGRGR